MTAIAKSAKVHPTAKKYCGWEEPAIWYCPVLFGLICSVTVLYGLVWCVGMALQFIEWNMTLSFF